MPNKNENENEVKSPRGKSSPRKQEKNRLLGISRTTSIKDQRMSGLWARFSSVDLRDNFHLQISAIRMVSPTFCARKRQLRQDTERYGISRTTSIKDQRMSGLWARFSSVDLRDNFHLQISAIRMVSPTFCARKRQLRQDTERQIS